MINIILYSNMIISIIPLIFYIIFIIWRIYLKIIKIFNFAFFFNFIFFNLLSIFLLFIFIIPFNIFLLFNLWRYLKFFKKLGHFIYFKKLSIYFTFWQYIYIYIYKYIYEVIQYIFIYIINIIFKVYNIFFFKYYINSSLFYFYKKIPYHIVVNIYNFSVIFRKIIFNLKFLEIFYYIYNLFFFLKKKDLNYKYVEDPILFRNIYMKFYTNIHILLNIIIQNNIYMRYINILFFFKNKIFIYLIYILNIYIKYIFNRKFDKKILVYLLQNLYNNKYKYFFNILKKYLYLLFICIYLVFLNLIYNIIKIFIYIFFYSFKIFYAFYKKNIFFIKCIIILFFIIYFYWIINYFFIILYKHYTLYLPLLIVKENFHFLNFEKIDIRNYFNLIQLHNTFIDLTFYNNIFYNGVLKQLNLKLNNYNFKFSSNININLYNESNNKILNKDTKLLNDIFEKWNKYHGAAFFRNWRKYKRVLNWSLRNMYKGKDWYKAIKREKLKGEFISLFNNSRYFENSKTEISNNIGFWENLHQLKRLPYDKEKKMQFQRTQAWYNYFKKRHASKKRPRFLLSYYIRLKNIPFSSIYKEFNTKFLEQYKLKRIKKMNSEFELYLNKVQYLNSFFLLLKKTYISFKIYKSFKSNDRIFFFKKYYRDFINIQEDYIWKNKIPSLLITEMRINRLPPLTTVDKQFNDFISMSHTDEMQQYAYYKDLAKKGCLKNIYFKTRYIYKKYPYRINKNKFYQYVIKNYFHLIDTGIKIPKKFFFFERSKLRNFNKLSHKLLNKVDIIYGNQLKKYKYWDKVFFLRRLNNKNLDFWGFFDYLKVNKYKFSKKNKNFTFYFLNRWKKDYYHMRVYLLRIISFLHYYTLYRKVKMYNESPFLLWMKNIKIEGGVTGLEALSTLSTIKALENNQQNNDNMNAQELLNETTFKHFKLRWHFKESIHPSGSAIYGNKEKLLYIINLFHKKFNKFFMEYNKINKYNNKYKYRVKAYKIKVLRKIKNLKIFFFFNNERNKGWRIFSYLNTFSIKYHLNHLFWHSPYSYVVFNKNNVLENFKFSSTLFYYNYNYNKILYNIIAYSYIFNILLNIVDIREEWSYYLTNNNELNLILLNSTFYYCYNYGNFYFSNLNELDFYIIFVSLLKNYYNNFLIRLIRYQYILEKKDLTIIKFISRYIKHWYNSIYFKMRYFIYQTHETYIRYIKRKYLRILRKQYWIKNHVDLIPFWFIFDYYTKIFIKYLLNKYFIKEKFVLWWLTYRLNYSIYMYIYIYIYIYIFNKFIIINNNKFIKYVSNIYIYIHKFMYYIINENIIFIIWYINLIKNNFIFSIYLQCKYNIFNILYKINFINYFYSIKINMSNIVNILADLNYLIYFKLNIEEIFQYLIKYLQNIKNKIIYFKSNYYYFKKQKLIKKRKRRIPLTALLSTTLKRNWFSLKNRSSNFFSFSNIYILNTKLIYNIINDNINIYNFFLVIMSNIPFIKKKIFNLSNSFLVLFIIYILFFIFIFFINKKFFNIFFINKKYKELNFELKFKILKNENIYNENYYKLNKKKLYMYNFFLFNSLKNINIVNFFNKKNNLWYYKLFNYKTYMDNISYDQFFQNKPIYKTLILITKFIHINKLNNYMKNYMKFFLIKKFPIINILNDILMCSESNIKNNNILFKSQKLSDNFSFNIIFLYWIIFIPFFFFQYILIKYHLKLYVKTKRRISYLLRTYLDNIRLFVKINKYLGRSFFKSIYKSKRWKDPSHVFLSKKKSKKSHFSINFIRYRKLYYRLSPIGSYYYWISKINIIQYLFSYKNFFFKTIMKSYYFIWIVIIYIIIFIYFFFKLKFKKKVDKSLRGGFISKYLW